MEAVLLDLGVVNPGWCAWWQPFIFCCYEHWQCFLVVQYLHCEPASVVDNALRIGSLCLLDTHVPQPFLLLGRVGRLMQCNK